MGYPSLNMKGYIEAQQLQFFRNLAVCRRVQDICILDLPTEKQPKTADRRGSQSRKLEPWVNLLRRTLVKRRQLNRTVAV